MFYIGSEWYRRQLCGLIAIAFPYETYVTSLISQRPELLRAYRNVGIMLVSPSESCSQFCEISATGGIFNFRMSCKVERLYRS